MTKRKRIRDYTELGDLTSEWILKNLLFVLFLGFLATIYIANTHYAERNVREIQILQKEIKELRWNYMSLQSENMFNSKRSELAKSMKEEGIRPQRTKPKKILVR